MDLNELFARQQVAAMKASASENGESQDRHFDKVRLYAEKIRKLQQRLRTSGREFQDDETTTVIIGADDSKAQDTGDVGSMPAPTVGSWENEGGALRHPLRPTTVPSRITSRVTKQYFVGKYVYTDLQSALAEFARQRAHAGKLSHNRGISKE